ncbi:MAG: hypothetical protein AAB642_03390 [Patescibacteria group bacterium]
MVSENSHTLLLNKGDLEITDNDFDGTADKVAFETKEGLREITRVLSRDQDFQRFSAKFLKADSLLRITKKAIEVEIQPLYKEAGLKPPPQKS